MRRRYTPFPPHWPLLKLHPCDVTQPAQQLPAAVIRWRGVFPLFPLPKKEHGNHTVTLRTFLFHFTPLPLQYHVPTFQPYLQFHAPQKYALPSPLSPPQTTSMWRHTTSATATRCCHPLAGCFPPLFLLPKKEHGNHTATDDSGAPAS